MSSFIEYLFSLDELPTRKINLELEIKESDGTDAYNESIYDIHGFLLEMAVQGFMHLRLNSADLVSAFQKLQPYFNVVNFTVKVRQYKGAAEAIQPFAALKFDKSNKAELVFNKLGKPTDKLNLTDIYTVIGDWVVTFDFLRQ